MKIHDYLRSVDPVSIFDLINRAVFDNILNGYSYLVKSGISIIYPVANEITDNTLQRRDAFDELASETFNPVCATWRSKDFCDGGQICERADIVQAKKYFTGEIEQPMVYLCEPLSLMDMTFPLRINDKVIGVLFGGQMLIKEGKEEHLPNNHKSNDRTDRDEIHISPNYYDVKTKINNLSIPISNKEILNSIISSTNPEILEKTYTTLDVFEERYNSFLLLGNDIQLLLNDIYNDKRKVAETQLLRDYDEELEQIDLSDPDSWWREFESETRKILEMPDIKSISVYIRNRSRYFLAIPQKSGDFPYLLPARNVLLSLSPSILSRLTQEENKDLLFSLQNKNEELWGYHIETGIGNEVCSTLVILHGKILDRNYQIISGLINVLCTNANIASLIFRLRENDEQYKRKVVLIGHSFRTPLQSIQFALEDLQKDNYITRTPQLHTIIENGMDRISDTREDLFLLLEPTNSDKKNFNFIEMMDYVLKSMEPIAKKHPCEIVKIGNWPTSVNINGVRYRLQRAFTCLLDNAIKYSFFGDRDEKSVYKYYQVRVYMEITGNYIKTIISNYGIGIPKSKLAAIKKYGERAEIIDKKKNRFGTGMGLPYAIDVIEEFGGWLEISSEPTSLATADDKRSYHRYLTTVETSLPISRRK